MADKEPVTVAWAAPVSLQAFTGDLEAVLCACSQGCVGAERSPAHLSLALIEVLPQFLLQTCSS